MAVQQLIRTIRELKDIHDHLIELGEQKREAILQNDIDELNRIVGKESRFTKRIEELNGQRIEAANRILTEKGYRPNPNVRLRELLRLIFNAEDKQAVQAARDELAAAVDKLKRLNEQNRLLLEQSLAFIDYSISLMTEPDDDGAVYRHPGQKSGRYSQAGLFDTKA